jgi:hypothetical protein
MRQPDMAFYFMPGANPTIFEFTATTPARAFLKVEDNIFVFKTR